MTQKIHLPHGVITGEESIVESLQDYVCSTCQGPSHVWYTNCRFGWRVVCKDCGSRAVYIDKRLNIVETRNGTPNLVVR